MSVIVTCDQQTGGMRTIFDCLNKAGLHAPQPLSKSNLTASDLTRKMLDQSGLGESDRSRFQDITPGYVISSLFSELVEQNTNGDPWGWFDENNIYLLNFLKELDQDFKFLLVYTSPSEWIARSLHKMHPDQENIRATLDQWHAYTEKIYHFHKHNQEKCLLVHALAPITQYEEFVQLCQRKLGLENLDFGRSRKFALTTGDTLGHFLGRQFTEGDTQSQTQFAKLEENADLTRKTFVTDDKALIFAGRRFVDLQHKLTNQKKQIEHMMTSSQQLKKDVENAQRQNELYRQKIDGTHKNQASLRKSYEGLRSKLDKSRKARNQLQSETNQLSIKVKELTNENAILMRQLHDAYEDIEELILNNRSNPNLLDENVDAGGFAKLSDTARDNEKAALPCIDIDLTRPFNGENWFRPESDGSWMGPKRRSSLFIGALPRAQYKVEIDIVGAISQDHIDGLKLSLDGQDIATSLVQLYQVRGRLAPLRKLHRAMFKPGPKLPIRVEGYIQLLLDTNQSTELIFEVPYTMQPKSKSGKAIDNRNLALRIGHVHISGQHSS